MLHGHRTISEEKLVSVYNEIESIGKTEQEKMNIWGELLNLTSDELHSLFCAYDRKTKYLAMRKQDVHLTNTLLNIVS
jgi:hypothetical protein